ncbi:GyrI-like domain-containing protein [Cytobacillus oceanisediminis]|uniref:GyrI-like domain-containing protein n=1 Tax=Cytobacillus oceanisediminis TaxID=665099 RepID=UPI00119DA7C5|nr:GyrI-like domain-containing protein [Cytobacillus oceanisediminis]
MTEIKQCSEIKLVGIRVFCPGNEYIEEIPKASKQLSERVHEIKNVLNPSLQHGAFVVDSCSDEEDGYWVCVEVSDYEDIPENMVTLRIPAQRYAVIRHKGSNEKIRETYSKLHQWIEGNGYRRLMDQWHLEVFHDWSNPKEIEVELMDTIM